MSEETAPKHYTSADIFGMSEEHGRDLGEGYFELWLELDQGDTAFAPGTTKYHLQAHGPAVIKYLISAWGCSAITYGKIGRVPIERSPA